MKSEMVLGVDDTTHNIFGISVKSLDVVESLVLHVFEDSIDSPLVI